MYISVESDYGIPYSTSMLRIAIPSEGQWVLTVASRVVNAILSPTESNLCDKNV